MRNILDEDPENEIEKINPKDETVGIILSVIMLFWGAIFIRFGTASGSIGSIFQIIVASFLFQLIFVVVGMMLNAIIELFKSPRRKLKLKSLMLDGVIFGFGLWIILILLSIFNQYFS